MNSFNFKGSICEEPSLSSALISRTMSAYKRVPTVEIDQNIGWLYQIKLDCERKIDLLRIEKKNRERARDWRNNMNAIAKQFCDPDSLSMDIDTRAAIIKQRLGCDEKRAYLIADIVRKWAKREIRRRRDNIIAFEHQSGLSAVQIAKKHKLTRQQVYNVIKEQRQNKMIK